MYISVLQIHDIHLVVPVQVFLTVIWLEMCQQYLWNKLKCFVWTCKFLFEKVGCTLFWGFIFLLKHIFITFIKKKWNIFILSIKENETHIYHVYSTKWNIFIMPIKENETYLSCLLNTHCRTLSLAQKVFEQCLRLKTPVDR